MKDVNKILLIGRLGGDPVMKETRNGHSMTTFSLATSRRVRVASVAPAVEEAPTEAGLEETEILGASEPDAETGAVETTYADHTDWHRIVVWGREAEQCQQYLKKGNPVFVEGSLRQRRFKGKDGLDKTWFEIHADSVGFLSGGSAAKAAMAS